jgi:hypothetical protein
MSMFDPTDEQLTEAAMYAARERIEAEMGADPDPRPVIARRILAGTLRPDWTTDAEVHQWHARDRERRERLAAMSLDEDESVVVADQAAS